MESFFKLAIKDKISNLHNCFIYGGSVKRHLNATLKL